MVQNDLIPILKHEGKASGAQISELFDMTLRLLVNLTNPELLLFREELPEDRVTRNYYMQLQSHRQKYKSSFVDAELWSVMAQTLAQLLRQEAQDREEDQQLVIERILILVRNILQVIMYRLHI